MDFTDIISVAGYGIEAVGVLVIVAGILLSILTFVAALKRRRDQAYHNFRKQLARSIILGLEFLIAGDIVRTVVVANTLENVAVLGLIILIRTFLSFTLFIEVEGRWPWQADKAID